MKVHMYENVSNFGDVLNKYIWPSYFGPFLERQDDILMFGIGTVLGHRVHHTGRMIVCGSGCGYGQEIAALNSEKWKIFFVRGPLTAKVLGLPATMGITDPGILAPEIFKTAAPTGRVVFVPHWETSLNPLWRLACIEAGLDYIDPLAPVADVIAALSGARLVVTEAMHGAILADAYRVPWVPALTSSRISKFKWQDWTDSLGVKPEYHDLTPLGMSDKFRDFSLAPGKADALMHALAGQTHATKESGKQVHSRNASGTVIAISYKVLPPRFRSKLKDTLYLNIGPKIDQCVAAAITLGCFKNFIARSANELTALSRKGGWLSDEKVSRSKHTQMQDKLAEVQKYLTAYKNTEIPPRICTSLN